jgi:2-desacetyl-2-hydroxyethyl bacteriochlorophyllide A dehydrogenase
MKSIIIKNAHEPVIVEEEMPKAGPGELVVEATVSGISSGTEMMLYRGTYPNFKLKKWPNWREYPVRPGYELAGKVVEVGPSASGSGSASSMDSLQPSAPVVMGDTSEFKVGDRVICLGSHQQYAKVPATLAAKIPDNVTDEQATFAILGTTTMHSTRRLMLEYGSTVAVIGLGVVGNLALQHAKLAGAATTIGLDLDAGRLELARKAGADHVVDVGREDPVKAVLRCTRGMGADAVVEASGGADTVQLAIDLMRDGGVIELLAWRNEASFIFGDLYFKEGKLIATRAIGPDPGLPYAYVRWASDQSLRLAMRMVGDGRLKADFFRPSRFPYAEIANVYKLIDTDQSRIGLQAVLVWR